MSYRLAVDVGGTFTDLLLFNDATGQLVLAKTPSTPADPSQGVLSGILKIASAAAVKVDDISLILHGTTVATNAILEGKGARVGLITNRGFEQILHVARGQTPGPLAGWIIMIKPDPIAPLELTRGISGRMTAAGHESQSLDLDEVRKTVEELFSMGVEAVTVSLLNSYANPAHEVAIKKLIQKMLPDLPVTISTEILPEFREYERTLTTVMNSYLRPKMRVYLDGMRDKLQEKKFRTPMHIVRSDGGVMSLKAAAERPVNALLSGPSGGAVAAAYIGRLAGYKNILSFDMGGTSTDVAVSLDGTATVVRDTHVGQYPVKVPSVDVRTVGAGGGSIAHVPLTGALRVGPQSAGAVPGPACYQKGGTEPTVTDANVVLGYLPPSLLGGEMILDARESENAVAKIASAMGLSLHAAAEGIYDIVNENMFGALRVVSVQRGYDPRDFALVALGGAGPLHANALSLLIGSWPSIIPPVPGVLSALGFLHSDMKNEFSRTIIRTVDKLDSDFVYQSLNALARQAEEWLDSERIVQKNRHLKFQVDMRYYRQGYEFPVDVDLAWFKKSGAIEKITGIFREVHRRNYDFTIDHLVEVVNLRVVALGIVPKVQLARGRNAGPDSSSAAIGKQSLVYRGKALKANIYDRNKLRAGNVVNGPAIVTQSDSTTLVLPGHHGVVDLYGNILIWPNSEKGQQSQRTTVSSRSVNSSRNKGGRG
jgi:N-methylhydantoinase A